MKVTLEIIDRTSITGGNVEILRALLIGAADEMGDALTRADPDAHEWVVLGTEEVTP
jgi:hypothetical protein